MLRQLVTVRVDASCRNETMTTGGAYAAVFPDSLPVVRRDSKGDSTTLELRAVRLALTEARRRGLQETPIKVLTDCAHAALSIYGETQARRAEHRAIISEIRRLLRGRPWIVEKAPRSAVARAHDAASNARQGNLDNLRSKWRDRRVRDSKMRAVHERDRLKLEALWGRPK